MIFSGCCEGAKRSCVIRIVLNVNVLQNRGASHLTVALAGISSSICCGWHVFLQSDAPTLSDTPTKGIECEKIIVTFVLSVARLTKHIADESVFVLSL